MPPRFTMKRLPAVIHAAICLCLLLLLPACRDTVIAPSLPQNIRLYTGDIVLRTGRGADSRAITTADSGCPYSHIGMVIDCGGSPFVIHIVPDATHGRADTVTIECAERFFAPRAASHGAIYRIDGTDSTSRHALKQVALSLYGKGLRFDRAFDAADHSAFYCTELIWYIYMEAAGIDLTQSRRHSLPLMPPLIFCSDITEYKDKTLIHKY